MKLVGHKRRDHDANFMIARVTEGSEVAEA
jgi:hypothetical protein